MKIVHSDLHLVHDPQTFIQRGRLVKSPERPERAHTLLSAAIDAGHMGVQAVPMASAAIELVHSARYLDFLENGIAEWSVLPNAGPEMVPNTHPNRFASHYASHIVARAGFHQGDTSCPISAGTWRAARGSVDIALNVGALIESGARSAYGLCRPPGHHAFTDMASGFCYLNNVAVLAESLRLSGAKRVAVLDIDIHHGNGTQQIFYERSDVLTVSVHADPDRFPMFFSGYSDETGHGEGEGFNLNLPLPHGSDNRAFVAAIGEGLSRVQNFAPDVLIVALGLDAYRGDPLSVLDVCTEGFAQAAAAINEFSGPVALIQEGGYPSVELGQNLVAFLGCIQD